MIQRVMRYCSVRVAWWIWLATVVACTATAPPREVARPPTSTTVAPAQRFAQIVTTLSDPAMEGRGAGTQGIDLARDYIVRLFRQVGLQPAFDESYAQPFDVKLDVRVDEQSLAIVDADGEPVATLVAEEQFKTLGFSGSEAFHAPAVFAGYGIVDPAHDYDSYGGDESLVRGKAVVVLRYEPMDAAGKSQWADVSRGDSWSPSAGLLDKAKQAQQRGAAALLVVNPASHDTGALLSARHTYTGEQLEIPVMHISGMVFRRMLRRAGLGESSERRWQQQADEQAYPPIPLDGVVMKGRTKVSIPAATVSNVAGVLPGRGKLKDEVVVVGAHYDHLGFGGMGSFSMERDIHPGADDNASGVASLIMLAERFHAASQPRDTQPDHQRTIVFIAFAGEERGLLGSTHFVQRLGDAGIRQDQIVAMLNMDMVGRLRENTLWAMGVNSGDQWDRLITRAARREQLTVKSEGEGLGASDHATFQYARIPAIHFFTGTHEEYHTPQDTADKVNAAGGVAVTNFIGEVLEGLLYEPTRMAFVESSIDPHRGAMGQSGFRVSLGIMPDYATLDGKQGCGVQSVRPGSAAERAGLQAGDFIVKWNDQPLPNVRVLTNMLRQSEPGEKVTLLIRRGEALIEKTVTLEAR